MNRSRLALTFTALTLVAVTASGCSLLGMGGSSSSAKKPEPAAPKPDSDPTVAINVQNDTGADICKLHIREDTLRDAYGWSTNQLNQWDNPKKLPAGATTTIRIAVNKPFQSPDLHAIDCSGKTVARVYDKPAFSSAAGSTWAIAAADEGTIAAVQQERGIKPSVHPLNRPDPTPSSSSAMIEIVLENKCGSTVSYCRDGIGKSESTLNGGASQRISVNDGDKIMNKGAARSSTP